MSPIISLTKLPSFPSSTDHAWLNHILLLIEQAVCHPKLSVRWLAHECFLSERHFCRKVKDLTGQPPSGLILEIKLQKAKQLLSDQERIKVKQVAQRLNFSDVKYFSRRFKQRFGHYPSKLVKSLPN